MSDTTKPVFTYDVTEGGVLVRYGAEDGLDLTTPSDNPLVILQNLDRVTGLITNLIEHGPAILAKLAQLRTETGEPCATCDGSGGQATETGEVRWVACSACGGDRVQVAA